VFAVAGVVNTLIHLAAGADALVEGLGTAIRRWPTLAAFVVANLFSFWANSRWTFATRLSFGRYQPVSCSVSLLGLVA
jgi:putative flippase GtrA